MDTVAAIIDAMLTILLEPFRGGLELIGLQPTGLQVWSFAGAVLVLAMMAPAVLNELVLRQRQQRVTGRVIRIDGSGEAPATPTIIFRDMAGHTHEFGSGLPVNGTTGTVGASVEVLYDPLNPRRAREAGRSARFAIDAMWVTIAAGLFAFAFVGLPA